MTDPNSKETAPDRSATNTALPQEVQSNFLATISHELRTPLTALAGYGELLADGILGPLSPSQHDTVERMRAVTHQLTVMIDSILTFTNLQAGTEKPVVSSFIPSHVLREAAAIMEPIARKKNVDFAVTATDGDPLYSDRQKVRQILVHLADNALKFTPENGRVELSFDDSPDQICFAIIDNGIGISPENLRRLFQPFSQVDIGLTRRHGGIGLGLFISQSLAHLLGGRIEVTSAVGTGSTFSLIVPRR